MAVPDHREWSPALKRFLIADLVKRTRHRWYTTQQWWETLLLSGFKGRVINGRAFAWSATPEDIYPMAVQLAAEWEANGGAGELDALCDS